MSRSFNDIMRGLPRDEEVIGWYLYKAAFHELTGDEELAWLFFDGAVAAEAAIAEGRKP